MPAGDGQVQRHEVAEEDEVEQLGEGALALGPHLVRPSATTSSTTSRDELEAAADLRVLVVVAQVDEREHLAGDVAVLAPAADLVVAELGVRVRRRPAPWRSR